MNTLFFAALFVVISLGAKAEEKILICTSQEKVEGWVGHSTFEKVQLTAYYNADDRFLTKAVVKGAYYSDPSSILAVTGTPSESLIKYEPLEDAWFNFYPILPVNMPDLEGKFSGFLGVENEEGEAQDYIEMDCFLKRS